MLDFFIPAAHAQDAGGPAGGGIAQIIMLVGFVLMALQAVWLIVRCVIGFKALQERRAPERVDSWLW